MFISGSRRWVSLESTMRAGISLSATAGCNSCSHSSSATMTTSISASPPVNSLGVDASPTTCISLVVSTVPRPTRIVGADAIMNTPIMQPAPVVLRLHLFPGPLPHVIHAAVPSLAYYVELTWHAGLLRHARACLRYQGGHHQRIGQPALQAHLR